MKDKTEPQEMMELEGADIYPNWDDLIQRKGEQEPESINPKSELEISLDMLMDQKGQDYWENLFYEMNFPGMDLMAVSRDKMYLPNLSKEHTILKNKTRQFLKRLAEDNINDLRAAGIAESNIFSMSRGIMPVNWTVHLKYPLGYGGSFEFDNMVLIQCTPFHEKIHTFVNKQILSKAGVSKTEELYIPVPVGSVHIPINIESVGGGGKASTSISGKTNSNGGR